MNTLDLSTLKPTPIKHEKFTVKHAGKKYWLAWCRPEGFYAVYEDGAYCPFLRLANRTKSGATKDLIFWLSN
jgi:hypothetical protein